MQVDTTVIKNDEKAIFALRALYEMYGYVQYRMNKFEEYDLYVRNKDFLVSENIITFTDADRKLMALKPDVTLSIIKNGSDEKGGLQKVYYNENIYRVPKGTHAFKEIMHFFLRKEIPCMPLIPATNNQFTTIEKTCFINFGDWIGLMPNHKLCCVKYGIKTFIPFPNLIV